MTDEASSCPSGTMFVRVGQGVRQSRNEFGRAPRRRQREHVWLLGADSQYWGPSIDTGEKEAHSISLQAARDKEGRFISGCR